MTILNGRALFFKDALRTILLDFIKGCFEQLDFWITSFRNDCKLQPELLAWN